MSNPSQPSLGSVPDTGASFSVSRFLASKGFGAACSILAVSLMMSFLGWRYAGQESLKKAQERFEFHCEEIQIAVKKRIEAYELVLHGGLALFSAVGEVSREQWRSYTQKLPLETHYPGIQGLGYSAVVTPAQLPEVIARVRAEGIPDFDIRPPGTREIYTLILFLEPNNFRNQRAIGYDMFSEPVRRAAMELARDSGDTTISGKVKLVQETDKDIQAGFLMYLPRYAPGARLDSPEARRAALKGYVYFPFRMNNFMRGVVGNRELDVDFEIYDGTAVDESALLYDSDRSKTHSSQKENPLFTLTERLDIFGHSWTLHFKSLPAFDASIDTAMPRYVLATGVCISVLLFLIALSLAGTQTRALALAESMTTALRESEEKSRLLLESTGEAIYGIDLNGDCTFCNPASLRILGYAKPEDLLGKNMHWLIHHTHADGTPYDVKECQIYLALRDGKGRHIEDDILWRADGSSFPAEYWSYPQIRDGAVVGAVVAFQDITEKKSSRERILSLNERFELAAQSAQIGVWDWDVVSDSLVWDDRMYALYGIAEQDFGGAYEAWSGGLHPDDRVKAEEDIRLALSGEKEFDTEFQVVWPNGQIRHIKAFARVIRDGNGRPLRMTGANIDITEQRLFEQDLRESEEKFRAMSESSYDALIMIDSQDKIMFWSAAAEQLFGYSRDETLGRRMHELITLPEHQARAYPGLDEFARTGAGPVIGTVQEFMAVRKNGETFPVERSVAAFKMRDQWFAVGSVRDITERKKMEKLKKEFISTVSHELRTPLTSIHGSLGLVLGAMAGELTGQVKQLLTIASNNTTRLIALINDILDMEKIESGKMQFVMEQVDLTDAVKSAITDNQSYADGFHVRFGRLFPDDPVYVLADRGRLAQVMANLLSNAAKFSPPGETVDIGISPADGMVRVCVRDKGQGVPEEFRDRIFQKFAQADSSDTRARGGTGLGLNISKLIVEAFGGRIGFSSRQGHGSEFYFDLPTLIPAQTAQTASTVREVQDTARGEKDRPRIIHIEDDRDIREIVSTVLSGTADVTGATTLAQARELLAQNRYDLVILDVVLPDGLGTSLLEEIGHVPVMAFAVEGIESELAGRFRAVLLKSKAGNEELLATVKELLGLS